MKHKIKEALQQRHKNLGLSDEVFERVAASVETFITDENQIDGFVQSENTLNLLKSYQSVNDKLRAFENKQKNEPTPTLPEPGNPTPEPKPEPSPQNNPADMAKIIAEAVANAIKPISDELAGFKAEKTVNDTIAAVNTRIDAWGYGKEFPKEMEKARKNAMELYEAYGKKWTADELEAKIKEKFNQEVYDKGIDTTKPYDSDGASGGEAELDMTEVMKIYQKSGRVQGKE